MPGFTVTFEIVTADSAVNGDAESAGYIMPDGTRFDMAAIWGIAAARVKINAAMPLREAVRLWLDSPDGFDVIESAGAWLTAMPGSGHLDSCESRSIHFPDNATAASQARLERLLIGVTK